MFGFLFGELSAEPPEAEQNWTRDFRRRLESVDPAVAPTLPTLAGNAFMLRWESGRHRPMQSGFEMALDVLVAGLEVVLRRADVPL